MALEKKDIMVPGFKDKDGFRDHMYVFEKFPATKGLDIQLKLVKASALDEEGNPKYPDIIDGSFIKDVICSCVHLASTGKFDSKKFDDHFSGRWQHLMEVYNTAIMYNFDENFTEKGTEEQ